MVREFAVFLLLIYTFLSNEADSARILGVFPMPSISHQVVFRAYTQELAKSGHELVIITPNPTLPKDRPKDNVTEIDVSFIYKTVKEIFDKYQHVFTRGVITDVDDVSALSNLYLAKIVMDEFNSPEVKEFLENRNQHFDLIVIEAIIDYPLIVSHFFKAPVILLSSYYGTCENYETIGASSRHPILYPNHLRNYFRNLTFWGKVYETYQEIRLKFEFWKSEFIQNFMSRNQFGSDIPSVSQLRNNVEMLFVNVHPIFDGNRPVPPSVVYLGALHMPPAKELPQDLKTYLDNSKRGVIYVSFGTNIHPSRMHKDFLDEFLDTFEALPYDVLWKFDGNSLERVPKNVKYHKWFPQRDLLLHPNIKLFVTQGGLQSTDEAIISGVPLLGIPMLGDQWFNVNKYVELGIGVRVESHTLTSKSLLEAINTVLSDDSYRENIENLRSVMYDQPQTPLERAVWWTEHLLRHGGARHLRGPAANMSYIEYLMTDVVIVMILVATLTLALVSYIFYYIVRLIIKRFRKKDKVKEN